MGDRFLGADMGPIPTTSSHLPPDTLSEDKYFKIHIICVGVQNLLSP